MPEANPFEAVISLGLHCQCAHQIRRRFKVNEAYPFDWVVTPPKTVVDVIKAGFELQPTAENLRLYEGHVRDERTGVRYFHDFPIDPDFMDAFDDVRDKYAFLASRARARLASDVLFVAHAAPPSKTPLILKILNVVARGEWRLLIANPPTVPLAGLSDSRVIEAVVDGPKPATRGWRGNDQAWDAAFDKALAAA